MSIFKKLWIKLWEKKASYKWQFHAPEPFSQLGYVLWSCGGAFRLVYGWSGPNQSGCCELTWCGPPTHLAWSGFTEAERQVNQNQSTKSQVRAVVRSLVTNLVVFLQAEKGEICFLPGSVTLFRMGPHQCSDDLGQMSSQDNRAKRHLLKALPANVL